MTERVPDQILARAKETPEAPAIRQWSRELTFRQLAECAEGIAVRFRAHGVGPEVRVGICGGRTPETVAAMLGCWLAGGAYVPLDQTHPRRRVLEMIGDAGITVVAVDAAGRELVDGTGRTLLDIEHPESTANLEPLDVVGQPAPEVPAIGHDQLAHVLYTSGSAGRPKGVLTTHGNLAAFVGGASTWTGDRAADRVAALSSFGFDATTVDLWVPLALGACVQLIGEDDRADPARLQHFLAEHRVGRAFVTPAVLGLLDPDSVPELRTVLVGGEVVPPRLVGPWTARPDRRFVHCYGPTEGTVIQITTEVAGTWTAPLPLGSPVPGYRAYVLDDKGNQVGVGGEGELLIGGAGVARGYLDRPRLTAERFVPDPDVPGARLYRTGDMVRRVADDVLAFVGRRDGQVQIRGQRIEVGEVEAALRTHPSVGEVAVVAVPVEGVDELELVAFVTSSGEPGEPDLEPEDLQKLAGEYLTPAMVPRRVVRLSRFPLGSTGKIDRGELRELAVRPARESDEPREATGRTAVAELWHRVLGGSAPDPDADFFLSGGHSIAAMRLVALVRRELGKDIGVADVFGARTLSEFSHRVDAAATVSGPRLRAGHPPTIAPSQRRLWFLDQLVPDGTAYNVGFAERLHGPLRIEVLRAALGELLDRQQVLRWRIPHRDGSPYAVCDDMSPAAGADSLLPVVDLDEADLPTAVASRAARRFDLAAGPLWDAALFRLGHDDHVLCLAFHHAIVDGWSQAPLYADLSQAYARLAALDAEDPGAERVLPALEFEYADYAAWREERDENSREIDRLWWSRHLADASVVLDLPRDRPRPAVQTYAGAAVSATLSVELDAGLRSLAGELGTPPATVVLAGLAQALHRTLDAADIVIGGIAADRELAAVADVVGFFVDIVPLRFKRRDDASFSAVVRECLDEYLAATAHPAAPLEQIVDVLRLPRDPRRSPLVQVAFNVYNFAEPRLDLPGLVTAPVPVPVPGSPFDLTVYLVERAGRFVVDFVYNPDLYDTVRMERFASDLVALLTELVAAPDRQVGQATTRFRTDGVPAETGGTESASSTEGSPATSTGPSTSTPATPTERMIADVWQVVLDIPVARATDNFFDVGGTSLSLVAVHGRLVTQLGRSLAVVDLFRFPTIRALAAHLDGTAQHAELDRAAQIAAARRRRTTRYRRRP